MKEFLKTILNAGTASFVVSAVNFLTFVILPSYFLFKDDFAAFADANIFSGFYNSIIATSAGSVALFAITSKNKSFVTIYLVLTVIIFFIFLFWADTREAQLILGYLLLSIQNFSITSKRYLNDKVFTAYKLTIQPAIFLFFIFFQDFFGINLGWTSLFLLSSIISVLIINKDFFYSINIIRYFESKYNPKRLYYLLLASSSLPLLVQMDLPYIKIYDLDVAYFSIIHKLIYSIPVAIIAINIPTLIKIYSSGNHKVYINLLILISFITAVVSIFIMLALNIYTDIFIDLVMIFSVAYITFSYSFLNAILSVLSILESKEVFYIVFLIAMASCFGYLFNEFKFFIIFKATVFMIFSIYLKMIYLKRSHE